MQFSIFDSILGLGHALTTREGGVSQGQFASLNLAFHVGDDAENVRENRRLLATGLGIDAAKITCAKQVHGDAIVRVNSEDIGRGALDWESAIPDCDALVTQEKNAPLLILVADCAPILIVDEENQALAVVHAGWRGAVAGIAGKTIVRMAQEFGSRPESLKVAIGPCLSIENLEIGPEVAEQIALVDESVLVSGWAKPHLDLRGLIANDLKKAGVSEQNLEISPLCPKDNPDLFFSHRGQNGAAGRFGIIAWWK